MKLKHAVTFIIIGHCLEFFGYLQKILHTPIADNILIVATILKILGGILLLYKILTHPKAKEVLDW